MVRIITECGFSYIRNCKIKQLCKISRLSAYQNQQSFTYLAYLLSVYSNVRFQHTLYHCTHNFSS